MDPAHKKILKAVSLELRHLLEGYYDRSDRWHPGDLELRLAAIGIRRDRDPVPEDELPHLSEVDREARRVVDAYLKLRNAAGINLADAVDEFVRETAYTWANRLLALRCMEARELIDEIILQKDVYGGRSLEHHRLAQREPELCTGDDDGLFEVLNRVFTRQAEYLPLLFDPKAPGVALRPSAAAWNQQRVIFSVPLMHWAGPISTGTPRRKTGFLKRFVQKRVPKLRALTLFLLPSSILNLTW